MKRLPIFVFAAVLLAAAALWAEVATLAIQVDRESQVYKCGEEAAFTIAATDAEGKPAASGTLTVRFLNDFRKELRKETFDLAAGNPITVKQTMSTPSFLSVVANADGKEALAGAAFDPLQIQPAQACPNDFNAYWDDLKRQVRELPEDLTLEEIPQLATEKRTVYRLKIRTLNDKFAHGFLSLPKNQGEGPFPVICNVPGAGPGVGPDLTYCEQGFVTLHMNVFPYPVSLNPEERAKQMEALNATHPNKWFYCYHGSDSRDTYFFRDAYLGIERAIEYVANRPDTDASRMGYWGVSQGGASALILGGLYGKFKVILSGVPALCDHGGAYLDRSPGWPKLYDTVSTLETKTAGPYLDGVNFARNIHSPIRVTVGFIDQTCSASSVYAAYNTIPAKDKVILDEVKFGHSVGPKYREAEKWILESLK